MAANRYGQIWHGDHHHINIKFPSNEARLKFQNEFEAYHASHDHEGDIPTFKNVVSKDLKLTTGSRSPQDLVKAETDEDYRITIDGYSWKEIHDYHNPNGLSKHTWYRVPTCCVPPVIVVDYKFVDSNTLQRHELSAIFQDMPDTEFLSLIESIATKGIIDNVIKIHEGQILDGWHRYRACQELNILRKLRFQEWDTEKDGDPVDFVYARNMDRKHLTPSQRAQIAVHFNDRFGHGGARSKSSKEELKTLEELANEAKVSVSTMKRASMVENLGDDKVQIVIRGIMTATEVLKKDREFDGSCIRGIYVLTHRESGMQYVGQSSDVLDRIKSHFKGNSSGSKLMDAISEFGTDAFDVEIKPFAEGDLNALEAAFIEELNSLYPNGYNQVRPAPKTRKELAKGAGVSKASIDRAIAVEKLGEDEAKKVIKGKIAATKVIAEAKKQEDDCKRDLVEILKTEGVLDVVTANIHELAGKHELKPDDVQKLRDTVWDTEIKKARDRWQKSYTKVRTAWMDNEALSNSVEWETFTAAALEQVDMQSLSSETFTEGDTRIKSCTDYQLLQNEADCLITLGYHLRNPSFWVSNLIPKDEDSDSPQTVKSLREQITPAISAWKSERKGQGVGHASKTMFIEATKRFHYLPQESETDVDLLEKLLALLTEVQGRMYTFERYVKMQCDGVSIWETDETAEVPESDAELHRAQERAATRRKRMWSYFASEIQVKHGKTLSEVSEEDFAKAAADFLGLSTIRVSEKNGVGLGVECCFGADEFILGDIESPPYGTADCTLADAAMWASRFDVIAIALMNMADWVQVLLAEFSEDTESESTPTSEPEKPNYEQLQREHVNRLEALPGKIRSYLPTWQQAHGIEVTLTLKLLLNARNHSEFGTERGSSPFYREEMEDLLQRMKSNDEGFVKKVRELLRGSEPAQEQSNSVAQYEQTLTVIEKLKTGLKKFHVIDIEDCVDDILQFYNGIGVSELSTRPAETLKNISDFIEGFVDEPLQAWPEYIRNHRWVPKRELVLVSIGINNNTDDEFELVEFTDERSDEIGGELNELPEDLRTALLKLAAEMIYADQQSAISSRSPSAKKEAGRSN